MQVNNVFGFTLIWVKIGVKLCGWEEGEARHENFICSCVQVIIKRPGWLQQKI